MDDNPSIQVMLYEKRDSCICRKTPIHYFETERSYRQQLKGFQDADCIENIVEKGEIAHFEQFHLFPKSFSKVFFFNVLQ